jgi:hypothetical protein
MDSSQILPQIATFWTWLDFHTASFSILKGASSIGSSPCVLLEDWSKESARFHFFGISGSSRGNFMRQGKMKPGIHCEGSGFFTP